MHENGRVFGRFFAEIRPTCARILAQPRIGGLPAPGLVGLASIWPVVVRVWRWRDERRKKTQQRQREKRGCRHGGLVTGKEEEEERSQENYKNAPPSSIFVPNCSILDTASLIYNLNSKLKLIIRSFIGYSLPRISRFDFNKPQN